jgi:sugar phosphate isomerase/epimerase
MDLIVFSKSLRERTLDELISLAHQHGFAGYDLCVRAGYAVNPENAAEALPEAARRLREEGLVLPLITAEGELVTPDHPTAETMLAAMDAADVRLIKLGYFRFNPLEQDYWAEVDRVRRAFAAWQEIAARYHVKICYHTPSGAFMGLNASALMHLLQGFDPACLGAYLDAGHLRAEGETWATGVAMVREYLSAVAVKDVAINRAVRGGHGQGVSQWVPAGQGLVDWTAVFGELGRVGFDGPVSIHCEYEVPEEEQEATFAREVRFFREMAGRA